MSVIEAVNVSKSFGEVEAVKDVTLRVRPGEFFGLFGPNGAGKTTLLRMLTGQLEPDSGEIWTAGASHGDPLGIKRATGIVPEVETPPTFLTAREYLELSCLIRGLDDVRGRVERWLAFFEMEGMSDVLCRDLSKGQRQKVMLASGFIHEPEVLLLDEPFINLDPIYQRRVREYLTGLIEEGRTVFMCTHILEIAERLCTRVAVLNLGRIVDQGTIYGMRATDGENLEDIFIRLVQGG
ncbi:MAG: ABC transporter ATP-binding protein [Candidatus Bathyarchaeota archaeon]|nr:MAG: ABC transporter ATP-binding protein [Candidatus Bathyarchaeota archaeon]